jgi:hypothetical protein
VFWSHGGSGLLPLKSIVLEQVGLGGVVARNPIAAATAIATANKASRAYWNFVMGQAPLSQAMQR